MMADNGCDPVPGGRWQGSPAVNLVKALEASERARYRVKPIRTFSRLAKVTPWPVQPKIVIYEVLRRLRVSLPTSIRIEARIASSGVVMADLGALIRRAMLR